jgi:hypothetical protein
MLQVILCSIELQINEVSRNAADFVAAVEML